MLSENRQKKKIFKKSCANNNQGFVFLSRGQIDQGFTVQTMTMISIKFLDMEYGHGFKVTEPSNTKRMNFIDCIPVTSNRKTDVNLTSGLFYRPPG